MDRKETLQQQQLKQQKQNSFWVPTRAKLLRNAFQKKGGQQQKEKHPNFFASQQFSSDKGVVYFLTLISTFDRHNKTTQVTADTNIQSIKKRPIKKFTTFKNKVGRNKNFSLQNGFEYSTILLILLSCWKLNTLLLQP